MNASPNLAYGRLQDRFTRIATLNEAAGMLGWDAAAMMPPGGAAARGDQLAVLAGLAHGQLTAPSVGDDLAEAEAPADPWRQANLRLMRHAYTRATAIPSDLVEAAARANSACETVWREARRTADFALVAPILAEVVRLTRLAAEAMAPALGLSPYDALMDGYQPGITAADVTPVFTQYEAFLRDALPKAQERQAKLPAPVPLPGHFPADRSRRRCAAGFRRAPGWNSPMRGWTVPPIRSAAAPRPMCASPPAMTSLTRRRRSWACCMKPGTRCMNVASRPASPGSPWARRLEWARMRANP